MRLAQLTGRLGQLPGRPGEGGHGGIDARDAHLVAGLELGEEAPQQRQVAMHPVMIGADEDRNVRPGAPGEELGAKPLPGGGQLLPIGGKVGAPFRSPAAAGDRRTACSPPGPFHQNASPTRSDARHPAPQHHVAQAELAREIGQDGGMTERIG